MDPNPDVLYCAVANVHTSSGYGFSYDWVDCDDLNNKALRLCFMEPYPGCSTGAKKFICKKTTVGKNYIIKKSTNSKSAKKLHT